MNNYKIICTCKFLGFGTKYREVFYITAKTAKEAKMEILKKKEVTRVREVKKYHGAI